MKYHSRSVPCLILFLAITLSACGNAPITAPVIKTDIPTSLPSATNTPDPCAPENIETEVQKIHKLMREFDDGSTLAASVPTDQLTPVISNLQTIRRDAEDLAVPPCLVTLKTFEINHMNLVIGTLINLIGYANGTISKDVIDQGIALARQEHDKYTIELARVLGLTPVVATEALTQTPTP
jgi:hypothetical protein